MILQFYIWRHFLCHPVTRAKTYRPRKLSRSSLLHPWALHTSSSTSKCYSKIDSIKSDHFPLGRNINKSIQLKQLYSSTNLTQKISLFPSFGLLLGLELGSNQLLARSMYISIHATTQVSHYSYFCLLLSYYHTNKGRGVLGHPCYSQVFPH